MNVPHEYPNITLWKLPVDFWNDSPRSIQTRERSRVIDGLGKPESHLSQMCCIYLYISEENNYGWDFRMISYYLWHLSSSSALIVSVPSCISCAQVIPYEIPWLAVRVFRHSDGTSGQYIRVLLVWATVRSLTDCYRLLGFNEERLNLDLSLNVFCAFRWPWHQNGSQPVFSSFFLCRDPSSMIPIFMIYATHKFRNGHK